MPDCSLKLPLMISMMSCVTFFGFLGSTRYCRLLRLKLWVNLEGGAEDTRHSLVLRLLLIALLAAVEKFWL